MSFKAPNNYKIFYNSVIAKCEVLIELKYWDEIDFQTLYLWLSHFKTDEEQYLASLILYKLSYKNNQVINSMLSNLFHIKLPQLLKKHTDIYSYSSLDDWIEKLKYIDYTCDETPMLFSTVTTGEAGESGSEYLRLIRKEFVSKNIIASIKSSKVTKLKNKKVIIFIDDFIGSGDQICIFLQNNRKILRKFSNIFFTPLIAHEKGIHTIKAKATELGLNFTYIEPVESISDKDSCFHYEVDQANLFDNQNTISDLLSFYKSFAEKNKFSNEDNIFGFDNLSLALIFSNSIPDNSIALLHKKTNLWEPLYEKF